MRSAPPVPLTVRLTVAVRVVPPEVPDTVMGNVPVAAPAPALKVRVELAVGITEVGLKEAVTPLGRPEAPRLTEEPKPLMLVTVMVLVPLPPWVTVTEVGEADTEKSGTGAWVTVTVRADVRVRAPLTPRAENGYVPAATEPPTLTVSVLLTVPLAGGVAGFGA
jgi:hypothetical protein